MTHSLRSFLAALLLGIAALSASACVPAQPARHAAPSTIIPPQPSPAVHCFDWLRSHGMIVTLSPGVFVADSRVIDPTTHAVSRQVCPYATSN